LTLACRTARLHSFDAANRSEYVARVLIIDDELDVREAIGRVLQRSGHEVSLAADADAGLDSSGSGTYDVVIADVVMPGMNGVELIRELRQRDPDLPIIAISGGGNLAIEGYQPDAIKTAAYMAAAESAGANCCLTKPFEREALLDAIATLVA
jgi:CheY-like chemotaxis protein